jgi:HK97 family phage major capsid protein
MIARLEKDIEERNSFIEGTTANAQDGERDLTTNEMELIEAAQKHIENSEQQLGVLAGAVETGRRARKRTDDLQKAYAEMRREVDTGDVEYRSMGEYVADYWGSAMGDRDAGQRLEVFHRAAAHQTTADNPGLLPERIVEPVINGVDASRPLVAAIGPKNLGPGSWAYARVTQHTEVGVQSAEKTEMASRKMTVTKTAITAPTFGGYVNVSKQDIRRTSPGIVDMVIDDLAGQYAIETEDATATDLTSAATAGTVEIPATPTAYGVLQAVFGAVGEAASGLRAANAPFGRLIIAAAPDQMALVGPLFPAPSVGVIAGSSGFSLDATASPGFAGALAGTQLVMVPALASGTLLVFYSGAVRVFEDRYGAMQVNEPSVWGVQVGYAGDFETIIVEADGIISVAQAT